MLVQERLKALGAEVVVPLAKVTDDMETPKRVEILNDAKVDLAVRIECNFVETPDTRGAIMWTCGDHKQVKDCDKLARAILTAYTDATEMPVQEYNGESIRHKNDESFLRDVDAPTCALIMGYISNRTDDTNLNDEDFQKKVADSIVEGILAFLGIER
jgi:N-acetylmuramoyl-L-alanine amidase